MVWDSTPPERCEGGRDHIWGEWKESHDIREETIVGKSRTTERYYGNDKTRKFNGNHQKHTSGQFCQKCNAWRGSLGLEPTPELYIDHMVQVFREVRRVLRGDGTLWLNMGDSYCGYKGDNYMKNPESSQLQNKSSVPKCHNIGFPRTAGNGLKPKDLIGIPWRLALALQADGWYLRSAMPWVKRSAMPESCQDRPASALEYMFLLSKSQKYYFDMNAIKINYQQSSINRADDSQVTTSNPDRQVQFKRQLNNNGRNFRNTDLFFESLEPPFGAIFCRDEMVGLDVNPQAMKEAHFATFPEKLIEPCIKAGTSEKGCCSECGSPWVRVVDKLKRGGGKGLDKSSGWTESQRGSVESKTIGWKPGCRCNMGYPDMDLSPDDGAYVPCNTIPCIVLDPFLGAGTTFIVSYKLGRKCIGIELSKSYLDEIAIPRIELERKQRKWC